MSKITESKITESTVSRLQKDTPASGNLIEWDGKIEGLGVRITAGGIIAFVLSYRFEGKKHRYTIGRYRDPYVKPTWLAGPNQTIEERTVESLDAKRVRDVALDLKKVIRQGLNPMNPPAPAPASSPTEPTFQTLTDRYLDEHALNKRASSVRNDKSKLDNILLPRWKDRAVVGITQDDVETLKRDLRATPIHANRTLALLSKMFNLASLKWKYRPDNPVRGIQRFKEHERHIYLQREQVTALMRALDNYHNQNAADAIRLLLLTGARETEALKADWSEFDIKLGIWNKPRRHMKHGEEHHIPLSDDALELLRKMKPLKSGPLFPGANGEARVTIRKPWIQICRAAGLSTAVEKKGKRRKKVVRYKPNFHIHDLRHTYASWLVSNGVALYDVSKLLGHSRVATTERYAHHADESLRRATNVFGGLFREAGETR